MRISFCAFFNLKFFPPKISVDPLSILYIKYSLIFQVSIYRAFSVIYYTVALFFIQKIFKINIGQLKKRKKESCCKVFKIIENLNYPILKN